MATVCIAAIQCNFYRCAGGAWCVGDSGVAPGTFRQCLGALYQYHPYGQSAQQFDGGTGSGLLWLPECLRRQPGRRGSGYSGVWIGQAGALILNTGSRNRAGLIGIVEQILQLFISQRVQALA